MASSMTQSKLLTDKVRLIEELNTGEHGFLKAVQGGVTARLNRNRFRNQEVLRWAFREGWLSHQPWERSWSMGPGPIYTTGICSPDPEFFDIEVLWEILKPALQQHSGYSITTNAVWRKLGLYERGRGVLHRPEHLETMQRCLIRLAAYQYIWFQAAGEVWSIDIRKDIER